MRVLDVMLMMLMLMNVLLLLLLLLLLILLLMLLILLRGWGDVLRLLLLLRPLRLLLWLGSRRRGHMAMSSSDDTARTRRCACRTSWHSYYYYCLEREERHGLRC